MHPPILPFWACPPPPTKISEGAHALFPLLAIFAIVVISIVIVIFIANAVAIFTVIVVVIAIINVIAVVIFIAITMYVILIETSVKLQLQVLRNCFRVLFRYNVKLVFSFLKSTTLIHRTQ